MFQAEYRFSNQKSFTNKGEILKTNLHVKHGVRGKERVYTHAHYNPRFNNSVETYLKKELANLYQIADSITNISYKYNTSIFVDQKCLPVIKL